MLKGAKGSDPFVPFFLEKCGGNVWIFQKFFVTLYHKNDTLRAAAQHNQQARFCIRFAPQL